MHTFYNRVTDHARQSLEFANNLAMRHKHPLVTNLHLLWGILEEGRNIANKVLEDMKVDLKKLKFEVETQLGWSDYFHESLVPYDEDLRQCICEAIGMGQQVIGCHHLLLSILADTTNPAAKLLENLQVTQELINAHLGALVKPVFIS